MMFAVVLTLSATLCFAGTPMAEVAACMSQPETQTAMASQGYSLLCQDNPGLLAPGGPFYDSRDTAATLAEFEGMFKALTECAKAGGDLTPISSGKATWFAPMPHEPYTIYTQKAGSMEAYGTYEERVELVDWWFQFVKNDRYTHCPNLSDGAKKEFLDFLERAFELWENVFDYHPPRRAFSWASRSAQAAPSQAAWDHTVDQTYGMKERNGDDSYTKEETWRRNEWKMKKQEEASLAVAQAASSAPTSNWVNGFAVLGAAWLAYGAARHYFPFSSSQKADSVAIV